MQELQTGFKGLGLRAPETPKDGGGMISVHIAGPIQLVYRGHRNFIHNLHADF